MADENKEFVYVEGEPLFYKKPFSPMVKAFGCLNSAYTDRRSKDAYLEDIFRNVFRNYQVPNHLIASQQSKDQHSLYFAPIRDHHKMRVLSDAIPLLIDVAKKFYLNLNAFGSVLDPDHRIWVKSLDDISDLNYISDVELFRYKPSQKHKKVNELQYGISMNEEMIAIDMARTIPLEYLHELDSVFDALFYPRLSVEEDALLNKLDEQFAQKK